MSQITNEMLLALAISLKAVVDDYRLVIPQFHAHNRKRMKALASTLDDAIATIRALAANPSESAAPTCPVCNRWAEFVGPCAVCREQSAEPAGDVGAGMLPDEFDAISDQWYTLCERAPYATKIVISGELAEAIVKCVSRLAQPQPHCRCGCGLDTCKESWEPGCGLGTSIEHAVPVDAPIPDGEAGWVVGQGMPQRQDQALRWLSESADPEKLDGYFAVNHARRALGLPAIEQPQRQGRAAAYIHPECLERLATTGEEAIYAEFYEDCIPLYTEQPASAAVVPDGWMRNPDEVEGLATHLEQVAYRATESGDVDVYDQGCAMAAEVIRKVLQPMLAPAPDRSQSGGG